ncbi:MAG TPA: HAMP domain-containing sensor histidine kinase, partial [Dissulfurispiraceae bacterium]|nr:HAMP domain-containing sensor histidine kinase [Dissulfurispiraceae bacterium]
FWRPILSVKTPSSEEYLFGDAAHGGDSRAPSYTIGYAAIILDKEEMVRESERALWTMISSIAAFILAGSLLLFVMVRRITGPLDRLTRRVTEIEREGRFGLIDEAGDWEVRRLTRAFNSMGAALEQKEAERREQEQMLIRQSSLAAMGGMLAAISHQWRQPLNAVAIMIQNIRSTYHRGILNTAYLDQTVEKTMEQIRFMSETIDDFRSFIRPGTGKEIFDVCASVDQAVSLLSAQFRSHGVAVHVRRTGDGSGCKVSGFQSEFQQAVVNILNNAIDTILELSCGDEGPDYYNGEVSIDIVGKEDVVEVRIEDNGRGLPESDSERIFDPYFTTKEQGKGTGIGLYMAKIIIEKNMDGRLSAESLPRGARFTIGLPRARMT